MNLSPSNVGYACINLSLQADKVTTTRGMIKKTFTERGTAYASELALKNVQDLLKVVDWNLEHGFRLFRVTSDLFPWASEYKISELPDFPDIRETLEEIGSRPIRLTVHPGPFNHLAGQGKVLDNTIKDLEYQSEVFDLMGLKPSHWNKINIHAGGTYGDKASTLARFAKNFSLLSENLRARLTVENDDRPSLYTVVDLVQVYEQVGTPIVFDYFHHSLNPGFQTEEEAFMTAYATWDVRPVFHYSDSRQEREDPKARREAHADWLYSPVNTYGKEVDIVFESKMKELSILRLRELGT
ncbi:MULTISPECIES: UV DNA damage repair endonuclease UvsE [Spirosoma]|uniref:UV DNA damage repair endonuclease UvsE n=1 Tax=Spirosoma liriopis TaxID=2937440 RepID=A0ABT0HDQ2_9BACT|nr:MULTISPECIES: UV DNA damage repair endonuclease UvsE [Spirosoma]MCK8490290.1 UV DNA damage repair endonuclease UvsE [Spirosoma liriopis]UHG89665.1 UV DNA damage repair endonuclease UvsE [Spirosoma oryzicola]